LAGNRIKQVREEKGISTYELSKLTGISQSVVSKLENNKRSQDLELIEKIANALGVDIENLIIDTAEECPECGFRYISPWDDKEHENYHNKAIRAKNYYGFYYGSRRREIIIGSSTR